MIIGVCGYIGAGKSTIGNILEAELNYVQLSFASVLKEIISKLFCWDLEMLQGLTDESRLWREQVDNKWSSILGYPVTPRLMLERGGTEACRNVFGDNIFVGHIKMRIDEILTFNKNIVITDRRFNNEFKLIESYENHKIIHVYKDSTMTTWYNDDKSGVDVPDVVNLHKSKYEWIRNHFDIKLSNNSTIDKLKELLLESLNY